MAEIKPYYEKRTPSKQTAIDIFSGAWESAFPETSGLVAGDIKLFEDKRPAWVDQNLPNGIQNKSILELGPFEGYQTYLLERLGAGSIISIEGNSFNFLKCLIVKNIFNLSAEYLLGDFTSYLENTDRTFDLCWASGVLYHQIKPLKLLQFICQRSSAVFIWTHYYDAEQIKALDEKQRALFIEQGNIEDGIGDFHCMHYMRSYNISEYDNNIPTRWQGGNESYAYWLTHTDIRNFLEYQGLSSIKTGSFSSVFGLPCVSFLAWKDL